MMIKKIDVELEDERLECSQLELETVSLHANDQRIICRHRCIHRDFCHEVIKAYKKAHELGM